MNRRRIVCEDNCNALNSALHVASSRVRIDPDKVSFDRATHPALMLPCTRAPRFPARPFASLPHSVPPQLFPLIGRAVRMPLAATPRPYAAR